MPKTVANRINEISMGENCFICQHSNPNWIVELQDLLEELGIPVEKFVEKRSKHAGKLFEVKNNRLRVINTCQCVDPDEVIYMVHNLL